MAATLDGKLVVAISSRALFDFEEENRVFEQTDDRAYMQLQLDRLDVPAKPGVAFSLVRKLLAFNEPDAQRVEVAILSRNDPVSGMRVFRSAQHYGLAIGRGSFTRGQPPWRYLKPLHANLFLSTHLSDVRAALDAGVPAAQVYPHSARASEAHPTEVRIAFDGDAVLFSDEAERVFQAQGLSAFQQHEKDKAAQPLPGGPFKPLLAALHRLQQAGTPAMRIRTALVTARSAPAHERAIRTLMNWQIEVDEAMFLGGLAKGEFLREFEPDFFFDDQTGHIESAARRRRRNHRFLPRSDRSSSKSQKAPPMRLFEKWAGVRSTTRKIVALAMPYFRSEDRWKARGLLLAIVLLNLAVVYMAVLLNDWNRVFYDALQNKNAQVFWEQLGRFTYLAFGSIVIAVYKFYLTQLLEVRWRAWMTDHYLRKWLAHQAFYRMELARFGGDAGRTPDNPDQRIQQDLNQFAGYSLSLTMGLLNAGVTLVSFIGILWALSGTWSFTLGGVGYTIPGFMVWAAIAYCGVGSVLTHWIGRPQIGLNFQQEQVEADFRHHLVRVREYSEAIALDRGEAVEQQQLGLRFGAVLANYLKLIRAQKNLIWFNSFFGQAAIIFPFLVAAPRFFGGAIQLGELMQISSAFDKVQGSLAWFVDNYPELAKWRAVTDRLTGFEASFQQLVSVESGEFAIEEGATGSALTAEDLTLALPGGTALLAGAALRARPGEAVLLGGPSGSGKSTLFRAFAGIWPFGRGHVTRPAHGMFIPQRPYFPNGSLRQALAYPQPADAYTDAQLKQALADALLPQLADRLDDEDAWAQKLSGGEQQRLAIARVLLKKPAWVFADEATSALDEPAEQALYGKLLAQVRGAGGGLVSIAHRPGVAAFHDRRWTLEPQPEGAAARFRLNPGTA